MTKKMSQFLHTMKVNGHMLRRGVWHGYCKIKGLQNWKIP